jgi:hypothetical protein
MTVTTSERKTGVKHAEVITARLIQDDRGWLRLAVRKGAEPAVNAGHRLSELFLEREWDERSVLANSSRTIVRAELNSQLHGPDDLDEHARCEAPLLADGATNCAAGRLFGQGLGEGA